MFNKTLASLASFTASSLIFLNPSAQASVPAEFSTTCIWVSSQTVWQTLTVAHPVASITIGGVGWSVDARNYALVKNNGHQGRDAERLAPFNTFKYDQRFPFGALLMSTPEQGVVWLDESATKATGLPSRISKGSQVQFRINDADNALGDNQGSLLVCLNRALG